MKCQTIIAGVGGQGVLFAAKVFTEMAKRKKLRILGSQTFGMAQRGGSVMTHLKIGEFDSPLICEGDADLLLGLDCMEAHRTLPYLHTRRNGTGAVCVVNAPDAQAFPDRRVAELLDEMGVVVHSCNADAVALRMKTPMVANLVLLGFGSSREHFPFTYEEVCEATAALSGPSQRAVNLAALEYGRAL
ncbi:MAG: 2-oxoacid:acceptor oxidoreductase family protein [Sulfuritalea sp.]|jgi:indolepyruvate ferredoxin oxidoreductase beta subunit|nr:2-oxoacid:acceptor oxidoreductase family protein [Sulfuritalea sp.]